jgi:hypothetical protein
MATEGCWFESNRGSKHSRSEGVLHLAPTVSSGPGGSSGGSSPCKVVSPDEMFQGFPMDLMFHSSRANRRDGVAGASTVGVVLVTLRTRHGWAVR